MLLHADSTGATKPQPTTPSAAYAHRPSRGPGKPPCTDGRPAIGLAPHFFIAGDNFGVASEWNNGLAGERLFKRQNSRRQTMFGRKRLVFGRRRLLLLQDLSMQVTAPHCRPQVLLLPTSWLGPSHQTRHYAAKVKKYHITCRSLFEVVEGVRITHPRTRQSTPRTQEAGGPQACTGGELQACRWAPGSVAAGPATWRSAGPTRQGAGSVGISWRAGSNHDAATMTPSHCQCTRGRALAREPELRQWLPNRADDRADGISEEVVVGYVGRGVCSSGTLSSRRCWLPSRSMLCLPCWLPPYRESYCRSREGEARRGEARMRWDGMGR